MWRRRLWEMPSGLPGAERLYLLVSALLSYLLLFVHGGRLHHTELTLDEAGTWGVARRSLGTLLTLPTEFHSQPPLYYFVLHGLLAVDSSAWWLRFFSFFCCLLLVQFVLFGLDELPLTARVFLCLLFIQADFTGFLTTTARPYAMVALLTLVASVMLVRLVERGDRRTAVLYALGALAMANTMAFAVAALLAHGILVSGVLLVDAWKLGLRGAVSRHRYLVGALIAVIVGYLPYLLMAIHFQYQSNPVRAWDKVLAIATYEGSVAQFFKLGPGLMTVLWFLAAVAAVGERPRRVLLYPVLVLVPVAFVWFFMTGRGGVGVQYKYMTPAFIGMCLLTAHGFGRLVPRAPRAGWLLLPVLLGGLCWQAWPQFHRDWNAPSVPGNFQRLAHELNLQPGRKVVFFDVGWLSQHLAYEARHHPEVVTAGQPSSGWGTGGAERIDATYVNEVITRENGRTRCFYYHQWEPNGPFQTAFVPAMKRLGYRALPPLSPVAGHPVHAFCKG